MIADKIFVKKNLFCKSNIFTSKRKIHKTFRKYVVRDKIQKPKTHSGKKKTKQMTFEQKQKYILLNHQLSLVKNTTNKQWNTLEYENERFPFHFTLKCINKNHNNIVYSFEK